MSKIDPYKANRQFEREYYDGVPEIPYSMYEQNSFAFHQIRYAGVPEQDNFENDHITDEEIIGTIRMDYENQLIFNE